MAPHSRIGGMSHLFDMWFCFSWRKLVHTEADVGRCDADTKGHTKETSVTISKANGTLSTLD